MAEDKGWPPDETPLAISAVTVAGVRHNAPVAIVTLADPAGELRTVHLSQGATWDLVGGLMAFLTQLHA